MERLTYVTEQGEVLFQTEDLSEDEGATIVQLAKNERFEELEVIAERLANHEKAAEIYMKELAAAKAVYENNQALQSEVNEAVKSLTFKIAEARLLGDVDGDGQITTNDTVEILRAAAEIATLSAEDAASADVNGDGAADTADAVLVLQYASEAVSGF